MAEVVADEMKRAGINVEIAWGDWGTTSGRQTNRAAPDKGGWNLFAQRPQLPRLAVRRRHRAATASVPGRR